MIITNTVETIFPTDSILVNNHHIEVIAYFPLNETEAQKLSVAFHAIERQLQKENFSPQAIPKARMFLTQNGEIHFSLTHGVMGNCSPYWIVFPIQRWRDEQIQDNRLIVIMVEEMCHWIWQEFDEIKVKHKVIEVIRKIDTFKNATIENVFDMATL